MRYGRYRFKPVFIRGFAPYLAVTLSSDNASVYEDLSRLSDGDYDAIGISGRGFRASPMCRWCLTQCSSKNEQPSSLTPGTPLPLTTLPPFHLPFLMVFLRIHI